MQSTNIYEKNSLTTGKAINKKKIVILPAVNS